MTKYFFDLTEQNDRMQMVQILEKQVSTDLLCLMVQNQEPDPASIEGTIPTKDC